METAASTQTAQVIKYGDVLYLQHMSGEYLSAVDRGRYNFPLLGQEDRIKLEITGSGEGEITDGAIIKLKSTESDLGDRHILGAFADSHDCYYWKDGYSDRKQGFKIQKKDTSVDDKIRYGDEVYFTNLQYKNQRLSRCTWYKGYITTFPEANEWWILEAENAPKEPKISSEAALLNRLFEPDSREFSAPNMAYMAYCAEAVYGTPEASKEKLEQLGFKIDGLEHFIDFPDTNTQCIAVGDEEKIIIAFRGTENMDDWKTNLKLTKAAWKAGMVHSGFSSSINSVWPTATARLNSLRTNNQPIWLTGHSLGGALATLACGLLDDELPENAIAGVYTFGQPRVGDTIFAQTIDKKVKKRFFRVVNNNDIVPRIPRVKYQHVGNQLYFDALGTLHDNVVISWLNPQAIWFRLQGYYKDAFNLNADSVGDHRMGDYRLMTMRQLAKQQ